MPLGDHFSTFNNYWDISAFSCIGFAWFAVAFHGKVATYRLPNGVRLTVHDVRTCEVSRLLRYKIASQQEDSKEKPSPLAYINCDEGRSQSDFLLVEDNGLVGLFLVVDYEGFDPNRMLLLVHNMKTDEWHSRVDGLGSIPKGDLVLKYERARKGLSLIHI